MPASCKGGQCTSLSMPHPLTVFAEQLYTLEVLCTPQAHQQRESALEGRILELLGQLEQKGAELHQLEWSHADTLQEKSLEAEK